MGSRGRRAAGFVLLVGVVVTVLPLPALAQRVQSNVVLVRADDVIDEDLYAAGNTIVVSGLIRGDLIATAFDSIRIDGTVEGDVILISDRVEISGDIHGAVRVLSRELVFEGEAGDDLFVGAWTVHAGASSSVGRDVFVWARTAELLGTVGRDIEGSQRRLRIAGQVGGGIGVTTSNLTLLPGLRVTGDVVYTSTADAVVDASVAVGGSIVRAEAMAPNVRVRGIRLLATLVVTLGALGLGLGLLWAVPERSLAAARALRTRPLAALAWGVGAASVPAALVIVAAVIVGVTSLSSSGPLLLVLLPLALALAALVMFGFVTSPVPVSLMLGSRLRPEWSSYAAFVTGFGILAVVRLLPWIGGIVLLLVGLAGLGAWLVASEENERGREAKPVR